MNLNAFYSGMPKFWLPPKILLVMKLITLIIFLGIMQASATGFAQKINLDKSNASLGSVFTAIEKQTGYVFLSTDLDLNKSRVNINLKNAGIEEALEACLKDLPLSYKIVDKTIFVQKKEPSLTDVTLNLVQGLFQQDIIYKGIISDERGQPMAGASVKIKGASTLTKTNANGEFSIRGPKEGILMVNFVGYGEQQVKLSGSAELIKISMSPAATDLDGVAIVSTGYQDIAKERATGSFEVITAKQLEHSNDPNLLKRLEGITTSINFNNQLYANNSAAGSRMASISSQFRNSPLANLTIRGKTTLPGTSIPGIGAISTPNTTGLPLVVIDGIASPYSPDQIDPNTVESITILKDAAASSVWGSRAANGVIVIKTKNGGYNRPVSVSFGANVNVTEKLDLFYKKMMSVSDFIDAQVYSYNQQFDPANPNAFFANPTLTSPTQIRTPVQEIMNAWKMKKDPSAEALALRDAQLDALRGNDIRRDFTKYFLRNSVNQNYNLSLSGGTQKTSYYLSGAYVNMLANTVGSGSNRMNLNYNMSFKPFKNLVLTGGLFYSQQNVTSQAIQNRITGTTGDSLYPYTRLADNQGNALEVPKNPYRPAYLSLIEAAYGSKILSMRWKPLEDVNEGYSKLKTQTVSLNFVADYTILPWLTANVGYNYSRINSDEAQYYTKNSFYMRDLINRFTVAGDPFSRRIPLGDLYVPLENTNTNQTGQGKLIVNKTWNKHELSAVAGIDIAQINTLGWNSQYFGYDPDTRTSTFNLNYSTTYQYLFPVDQYNTQSGLIPRVLNYDGYSFYRTRTLGVYSAATYSYDRRYSLTATVRKDGNSALGGGANKTGIPYYSFGLAWNINNEKFYHIDWLPVLRIRSTFGYNGNTNPAVSPRANLDISDYNNVGGFTGVGLSGLSVSNRNLRPEKTGILNLGLDFGFKGNRVSGSLEYYDKKTTDMINSMPNPDPTFGFSGGPKINTADMHGQGLDFTLNTVNIQSGRFNWNSNFLSSWNRVKVTKLLVPPAKTIGDVLTDLNAYNVGYDLQRLFALKWGGLNPVNGNPMGYINGKLVDVTDANYFTLTGQPMSGAVYKGSSVPVIWGSFRNSFSYGQFTVSANLLYKLGYYFRRSRGDLAQYGFLYNTNFPAQLIGADYYQRWQKPGDELHTNVPSLLYSPNGAAGRDLFYWNSEINVQKADHVRLQEINLSYVIKTRSAWFIKNPVIYANVTNLGIIWRANKAGIDPEAQDYPNPHTYSIGFRANF